MTRQAATTTTPLPLNINVDCTIIRSVAIIHLPNPHGVELIIGHSLALCCVALYLPAGELCSLCKASVKLCQSVSREREGRGQSSKLRNQIDNTYSLKIALLKINKFKYQIMFKI